MGGHHSMGSTLAGDVDVAPTGATSRPEWARGLAPWQYEHLLEQTPSPQQEALVNKGLGPLQPLVDFASFAPFVGWLPAAKAVGFGQILNALGGWGRYFAFPTPPGADVDIREGLAQHMAKKVGQHFGQRAFDRTLQGAEDIKEAIGMEDYAKMHNIHKNISMALGGPVMLNPREWWGRIMQQYSGWKSDPGSNIEAAARESKEYGPLEREMMKAGDILENIPEGWSGPTPPLP